MANPNGSHFDIIRVIIHFRCDYCNSTIHIFTFLRKFMNIELRKRKLLLILSVIALVVFVIVTLVLGEILIRVLFPASYYTPETLKTASIRYAPSIFSKHVFPQEEQALDTLGWDNAQWYINELGYRGRLFEVKKPEDTIRIVFFGGSQVFDSGASLGADWPHQVESILRSRGLPNIEVINAGTPGHATFDNLGRLYAEIHVFQPDYVILLNAWNDIKYFRGETTLLRRYLPIGPDVQSTDPRFNYQNEIDRLLCESSQVYVKLRHRYYNWRLRGGTEGRIPEKPESESSLQSSEYGLKQYKLNWNLFVDCARNIGAVPILMTQPRLVSPNNSESERSKIRYEYVNLTHDALLGSFQKTDEIIHEVAAEKGVVVIEASKELTGKGALFRDHVHLTKQGSQVLAEYVAARMAEILVYDQESSASSQ